MDNNDEMLQRALMIQKAKQIQAAKGAQAPAAAPQEQSPGMWDQIKNHASEFAKNTQAMATGAANTMTLNYLPQITAGLSASGKAMSDLATEGNMGSWDDFKNNYQASKDRVLAHQEKLQSERPLAYGGGQVAGLFTAPVEQIGKVAAMAPNAALKATGMLESAPVISRYLRAGAVAGEMGLATNPGDVKGQSGDLQLDQRLSNAKMAVPFGLGGEAIVHGVEKAPDAIDGIRRWMTAKQLGANTSQMKQLLKEIPEAQGARIDQIEKFMDDNGMLNMGTHFSNVEEKSGQIVDKTGKKLEGLYSGAEDMVQKMPPQAQARVQKISGPGMANEFLESEAARLKDTHSGDEILATLKKELVGGDETPKGLAKMGEDISLDRLWKYRKSIDENINFAGRQGNATLARSYVNLRNFVNEKIAQKLTSIDNIAGTQMAPELAQTNQLYSNAALVNKISNNTKAREMAKYVPGLVGTMSGAGAGLYDYHKRGNIPEALATATAVGLLSRGARAVGPAMTYRGATAAAPYLQQLSKKMSENPGMGGQLLTSPWLQMQGGQ